MSSAHPVGIDIPRPMVPVPDYTYTNDGLSKALVSENYRNLSDYW